VTLVGKPVQVPAAPPDLEAQLHLEHAEHGPHGPELQGVQLVAFDPRHRVLADAGALGHVRLAPPSPLAHDANARPDSHILHPRRVARTAYLPRIGRLGL
jgi:hypothetical protein